MRDALAALDAALTDGTRPRGCGCSLLVPVAGPTCPDGSRPPATPLGISIRPADSAPPASPVPPSRFRYNPADPTPSVAGAAVGLAAGPADNRGPRPDRTYLHQRPASRRSRGDRPGACKPVNPPVRWFFRLTHGRFEGPFGGFLEGRGREGPEQLIKMTSQLRRHLIMRADSRVYLARLCRRTSVAVR